MLLDVALDVLQPFLRLAVLPQLIQQLLAEFALEEIAGAEVDETQGVKRHMP